MLLTAIIVGGIVVTTLIAVVFDYLGKKASSARPDTEKRIASLEKQQAKLEEALMERDGKIDQLTKEVSFVNKLLEDGTKRE